MKKVKQTLMLVIVVVIACAIIISAHVQTQPIIEERQEKILHEKIEMAFPELTSKEELIEREVYKVFKGDAIIGYVVITEAYGYDSEIEVMVALEKSKEIRDVFVLDEEETPGLGAKITEEDFRKQFRGITKQEVELEETGGEIDAITGATASSQAMVEAVREAFKVVNKSG